jgi:hypothetical protein
LYREFFSQPNLTRKIKKKKFKKNHEREKELENVIVIETKQFRTVIVVLTFYFFFTSRPVLQFQVVRLLIYQVQFHSLTLYNDNLHYKLQYAAAMASGRYTHAM